MVKVFFLWLGALSEFRMIVQGAAVVETQSANQTSITATPDCSKILREEAKSLLTHKLLAFSCNHRAQAVRQTL